MGGEGGGMRGMDEGGSEWVGGWEGLGVKVEWDE